MAILVVGRRASKRWRGSLYDAMEYDVVSDSRHGPRDSDSVTPHEEAAACEKNIASEKYELIPWKSKARRRITVIVCSNASETSLEVSSGGSGGSRPVLEL